MSEAKRCRAAISRKEAATLLGIGLNKLDELLRDKRLASIRVGRRVIISARAVEKFFETEGE